jgi:hypothetical protein
MKLLLSIVFNSSSFALNSGLIFEVLSFASHSIQPSNFSCNLCVPNLMKKHQIWGRDQFFHIYIVAPILVERLLQVVLNFDKFDRLFANSGLRRCLRPRRSMLSSGCGRASSREVEIRCAPPPFPSRAISRDSGFSMKSNSVRSLKIP